MKAIICLVFCTMFGVLTGCSDAGRSDATQSGQPYEKSTYLSKEAREIGCSIVAKYVSDHFDKADKPIVLNDTREFGIIMSEEEAATLFAFLIDGEEGDPDSVAIQARARAFLSLTGESAIENCDALRSIKQKRSFEPDPADESPPVSADGLFFEYEFHTVSAPLVDLDRGQAFLWRGHGCGPLCGGTGIEIFARQTDGSWTRTDYQGLSIR